MTYGIIQKSRNALYIYRLLRPSTVVFSDSNTGSETRRSPINAKNNNSLTDAGAVAGDVRGGNVENFRKTRLFSFRTIVREIVTQSPQEIEYLLRVRKKKK